MRKYAVRKALPNIKSCFTNLRNGNVDRFTPPYMRRKDQELKGWSWGIEKSNVSLDTVLVEKRKKQLKKTNGKLRDAKGKHSELRVLYIFKDLLGEMKYCSSKQAKKLLPNKKPAHDCEIQKDQYGQYFLSIPVDIKPIEKVNEINEVTTLDPGGRKFVVSYSPTQGIELMGHAWATTIMKSCVHVDNLQSRLDTTDCEKEKRILKRDILRQRLRVSNMKKEMRHKIASHIIKNTDLVMLPKLEIGKMVVKAGRRLRTKTARMLLQAGHGMFFDHVRFKCYELGKHFMQVPEQFTSKTCPMCGSLNRCNEVYSCRACGFKHDRDVVGAANILLRAVRI